MRGRCSGLGKKGYCGETGRGYTYSVGLPRGSSGAWLLAQLSHEAAEVARRLSLPLFHLWEGFAPRVS